MSSLDLGDIEKYKEERFTVARVIAETISKYLDEMDTELKRMYVTLILFFESIKKLNTIFNLKRFLSFLSLTKLTVIFEILNPDTQHVEDLSYLKE